MLGKQLVDAMGRLTDFAADLDRAAKPVAGDAVVFDSVCRFLFHG